MVPAVKRRSPAPEGILDTYSKSMAGLDENDPNDAQDRLSAGAGWGSPWDEHLSDLEVPRSAPSGEIIPSDIIS